MGRTGSACRHGGRLQIGRGFEEKRPSTRRGSATNSAPGGGGAGFAGDGHRARRIRGAPHRDHLRAGGLDGGDGAEQAADDQSVPGNLGSGAERARSQDSAKAIKNFAVLDGAFVIREDGVVLAAGRYLQVGEGNVELPLGLGARHAAAAAMTVESNAGGRSPSPEQRRSPRLEERTGGARAPAGSEAFVVPATRDTPRAMPHRFLEACRRRPVDKTPIWLMRQAGATSPSTCRPRQGLLPRACARRRTSPPRSPSSRWTSSGSTPPSSSATSSWSRKRWACSSSLEDEGPSSPALFARGRTSRSCGIPDAEQDLGFVMKRSAARSSGFDGRVP